MSTQSIYYYYICAKHQAMKYTVITRINGQITVMSYKYLSRVKHLSNELGAMAAFHSCMEGLGKATMPEVAMLCLIEILDF